MTDEMSEQGLPVVDKRFEHVGVSTGGIPFGKVKRKCPSTCGSGQCARERGHRGKHLNSNYAWPVEAAPSGRDVTP